jgi:hypothetical protein
MHVVTEIDGGDVKRVRVGGRVDVAPTGFDQ